MILELGDGRELSLPDEVDDESARQIGKLILALEKRAANAEKDVNRLQMQIDNLRASVASLPVISADATADPGTDARHAEVMSLLNQILRIGRADRVLVYDDVGLPRSRIIL